MKIPVFDLHCDTALALWDQDFSNCADLYKNDLHIDLERAGKLAGYAQCFACFTSTLKNENSGVTPKIVFENELKAIRQQVECNSEIISFAGSAQEISANLQTGKMSAILTIEGPAGFGFDAAKLEELYKLGFRITTLGWNEQNPLTGSCVTGGGLTEKGRGYVLEAQRLGMVIDVSHISDAGFWDIMEITKLPIIASHSNSRNLWNIPRNITDEMYRAICKTGGTVGINLYSDFLGENPDINTVCNHIEHFLQVSGEDKHVSLGADFDGCERLPTGISGVQDYPKVAECLLARGYSENTVYNIFWNNALGVMDRCST